MLAFPELAWGHSRIVGALEGERFVLRFNSAQRCRRAFPQTCSASTA